MSRLDPRALLVLPVLAAASGGACAPYGEDADLVVVGGQVLTVDANFRVAEAMAVRDGRIQAVGSDAEIRVLVGPETRVMEIPGMTVAPGLADNHLHRVGGGDGVDLSRVRTMEELLGAITERARAEGPGELVTTNSDWHEGQLREQRLPLRRDLDQAAPGNPVVVVRGGHEYILNSQALEKWEITTETPVPAGGRITRYPDGELNGELVDTAKRLVSLPERAPRNLEERIRDQVEEYRTLHAAGLTSLRHPGSSIEHFRLLEEMKRRGLLTMRVTFVMRMRAGSAADVDAALDEWGLEPQAGDEWLRLGGVKLGVDGGFEGGLMREPYEEPWGQGGAYHGLRTMSQEVFGEVATQLGRRGWRVATHAVGDLAIDQVLAGYEAANEVTPIAGRRWVIEHGFIPREDHFPVMNRLGLLVTGQHHLYLAAPSLEKYWGRERAERVTPMRAYLDAGVMVSAGTDSPVVPYPPLWVLHHFVTRETISGGVFGADQRVSVEEGLRLLTHDVAYVNFEEDLKGTLEPGKLADFVVLSDDPRGVPADEIEVERTVVAGETVFARRGARGAPEPSHEVTGPKAFQEHAPGHDPHAIGGAPGTRLVADHYSVPRPVFAGVGADAVQIAWLHMARPLDLDGDFAFPAKDEVALQTRLGAPEPNRNVRFPIAPVTQEFHQDEVFQRPAELGPGRPLDAASGLVSREPDVEQIEPRRPGENGPRAAARKRFHEDPEQRIHEDLEILTDRLGIHAAVAGDVRVVHEFAV